jgi:hypothetical protein
VERRRRGSKALRKGRRPRVRVRLKEYKAAGCLKKRMMMIASQEEEQVEEEKDGRSRCERF